MKRTKLLFLFLTMAVASSLTVAAAEWDKPVPANSIPESQQTYYFYNVSVEKFLSSSSMKATLQDEGKPVNLKSVENGDWTLEVDNGFLYSDLEYVGDNGGSKDSNIEWCIESQEGGAYYYIRPSKSDPDFSWSAYPDMWTGLSHENWQVMPLVKAEDGDIAWIIVSETDYQAFIAKRNLHNAMTDMQNYGKDITALLEVYNNPASTKEDFEVAVESVADVLFEVRMQKATEDNPFDVTSKYLRNADLTENWVSDGHDVPGWTMVPANFCGMGEFDNEGFYSDNKTLGSWSGGAFGDNKVYQTITGIPNGKYKFGNYGLWIRHTGEEGDPITGAYIYAKVGDKLFKEPLTDTGWWRGLSEVVFECRTGEAEVGIMFEGTNVGQCVILDFKLEYLGEKPASERLTALIGNSQTLIDSESINSAYANQLNTDITRANELISSGDEAAQEELFTQFQADYEAALQNQEAYAELDELMKDIRKTFTLGDSDEMGILSDYYYENEIEDNFNNLAYDNEQIQAVIAKLTELNAKAKNSVIASGTDVTDLLINGHFDTTGGWVATLNDFSIDSGKKVMEKWWSDWKAEQVVENVPNGTYRLEVQGFQWCSWDWAQSESDWLASDGSIDARVTSKLRLNDGETTIHNVFACGPTDIQEGYEAAAYFVPNDANTALKFFELGLYNNVVEATVTDHTLKVEFDCSSNGFWNCFYNLRLYYVGADLKEAKANLTAAIQQADELLQSKMQGTIRQQIEEAKAAAQAVIDSNSSKFDDYNNASTALLALIEPAQASIKDYNLFAVILEEAAETLSDEPTAQTPEGQQLSTLYNENNEIYNAEYPSLDAEGVAKAVEDIQSQILKAKIAAGINPGDDITKLIVNPSFENTYGNDETVGNAAHTAPFGWSMIIEGKECKTAQEMTDAGINSWTAIEDNDFTTDGAHSYCLLSAPVPDTYLYQTIEGLPAGTYKVTVDMNVTYEGGCSRLTGQRLLVNNNAQYYGKQENYIESELDNLHPEELSRTFAGYDEVNSTLTGESGDMGNMSTLEVEVTVRAGEPLVFGVRTDNNKIATNCNYEENWWDCCGRYKLDNFRLYCVSLGADVKGDVNGDGKTDISDVVAVINTMAGDATFAASADVNGDTKTDISDVVAIINIMAGVE